MRRSQRGMTLISLIVLAIMVGVIVYAGIRLGPIYLNQMKVRQLLNDVKLEFEGQGPTASQIQKAISRRLDIEYIDFPDRKDFKVSKTEDGLRVDVSYEDRVPYLANVYLVAVFDNSVEIRR